ncbi:MAG: TIGR02757 family protein [Treponema sp.]|nr:TIGR02757 family protein [Treponema sp.]
MTLPLPRRRPTIPGHKDKEIKTELDRLYRKVNKKEFILNDPVQFPHRFNPGPDREIAAFLAAAIAWGRRDLIIKSAEKMFALMDGSPYSFIMKKEYPGPGGFGNDGPVVKTRGICIHRTFFMDDFLYFCRGLKACYAQYGSLEALFASAPDIWEGIGIFRKTMAAGNKGLYSKHIANPDTGSACKRLHLALRWLVRREGPVDLGLWRSISPSSLCIPLDLHVGRATRQLGLLEDSRKANDKKAVVSLTEKLKEFCPEDPVRYDLALFGYSAISG